MKLDIYLRMDGIAGASSNYAHKNWTEIRSWHWGMNRTQRAQNNEKVEAVTMNRITVTKPVGIESPMLMALFAERIVAPSAAISVAPQAAKRGGQTKYIEIALENILIQSIETGANTKDEELLETVVFCFGKVKYEFFQNTNAAQAGATASTEPSVFAWDVSNRKPINLDNMEDRTLQNKSTVP